MLCKKMFIILTRCIKSYNVKEHIIDIYDDSDELDAIYDDSVNDVVNKVKYALKNEEESDNYEIINIIDNIV